MDKNKHFEVDPKPVTRAAGAPVANHDDMMTAGERGPAVLQDVWMLEKLAHFDREVIPERRMHAKGSGAHGKFTVTHDITRFTKASIFSQIGKETPVFMRFSTVAGERGAADAERDIRGFAMKYYTDEGNWDLVGNNTPVFFIRDPMQFPDLNRAVKRDPRTNMRDPQNNWDFWTMLPEALHMVTRVMSDDGLPASFRHMHGFGSHTFSMINANNERTWVKFHLHTQQGLKHLTDDQAAAIIAHDRESHQRDLYESIERGDFPRWKMFIQTMTEKQAKHHRDNPFDVTKTWDEREYPLIPVGMLELNRNPSNYFAEVEQAAFNPANVVPGISFSPDKLLQGRLFSYGDAQRYRLGVNHEQIPVNKPLAHAHTYHRDGKMRVDGNQGSLIGYHPNSYGMWNAGGRADPPMELDGTMDYHTQHTKTDDTFYQAGDYYRALTPDQRTRTIQNTANNIAIVSDNVKYRHAAHCYLADHEYGTRIASALGLCMQTVMGLGQMTREDRLSATSHANWAQG
ncbi:MAG: catalase [Firmicutes bacterium]|nr:catalase [Bacillota bacterium]